MQVWLSLHTADKNETPHISNIALFLYKSNTKDILGLQKKKNKTPRKKHITKPLRLERTKSHSLRSNNPIQNCSSVTKLGDTVTMGTALPLHGHLHMLPWSLGIQHHREAVCFLPTQQPGKIASCSVLACLVTNGLTLLAEKPTVKEGFCFWSVMSDVKKDKGRLALKSKYKLPSLLYTDPKGHSISCSALASATLHSAIADEYQVLQLLFLLKVQKHQ